MRTKRKIRFFAVLAVAMAILLSACRNTGTDDPENTLPDGTTATDNGDTTDIAEKPERSEVLAGLLRENMPVTDGSTSAIPLDAAVRAGIFGITPEEAEKQVVHTTSHDSFYNLLAGNCALAFSHLLSPEQYEYAENVGIEVEMVPIAREGFIFLVSADNPVDSLTVEQVRQIYSGEITNWSQVGGEDAGIIAYQRNIDSGSQNYMRVFMGDTKLTDAPTELRPGAMNTLVDAVAGFDGQHGGIGYSVYSYVGGMYDADSAVKILKINGVEPTFPTIADGSYPCTGYNYVVIRASEEENSPARNLVEWILTDAGQNSIAATGYFAPLAPTSGIDITIKDLNLMTTVGTGKEGCDSKAWYYEAIPNVPSGRNYFYTTIGNPVWFKIGIEPLDASVEEFIKETVKSYLDENPGAESERFECSFSCVNGYFSIRLIMENGRALSCAMFDMESGKRLGLSDIFAKGTAFVPQMNSAIEKVISEGSNGIERRGRIEPKTVFEGIEDGFDSFALKKVHVFDRGNEYVLTLSFIPGNNRYFDRPAEIYINVPDLEGCLLTEPRDMSGYLRDQHWGFWWYLPGDYRQEYRVIEPLDTDPCEFDMELRYFELSGFDGAEKINDEQMKFFEEHKDPRSEFDFEALYKEKCAELERNHTGTVSGNNDLYNVRFIRFELKSSADFRGKYVLMTYAIRVMGDYEIGFSPTPVLTETAAYDLTTGEKVDANFLFSEGHPSRFDW